MVCDLVCATRITHWEPAQSFHRKAWGYQNQPRLKISLLIRRNCFPLSWLFMSAVWTRPNFSSATKLRFWETRVGYFLCSFVHTNGCQFFISRTFFYLAEFRRTDAQEVCDKESSVHASVQQTSGNFWFTSGKRGNVIAYCVRNRFPQVLIPKHYLLLFDSMLAEGHSPILLARVVFYGPFEPSLLNLMGAYGCRMLSVNGHWTRWPFS